ncbi:DUF6624 domain-containing protein [Streptomyces reniochalinae]|uniref:Uncharacterized protein n=1 Tax=Streptomyces reniochalinae TaxID=2250578 RepID=A0A367EY16_9ACTN|nr:DUF6624 domain-containing protein [Streptomyces reniochalinae]RCG22522.1 hypothetical protein DQ392_05540 [Streptomyces reniochalinae]
MHPEPAPASTHESTHELAHELATMKAADNAAAAQANSHDPAEQLAWRRLTARHGDRLRVMLEAHGHWPTTEEVGEEGVLGAWLIAQHADRQLDVQRLALRLLEQAVEDGTAGPEGPGRLAFLRDRLHVNAGLPQRYGTQVQGVSGAGEPILWPVEDPEKMDTYRSEVGIAPFAEYVARFLPKE